MLLASWFNRFKAVSRLDKSSFFSRTVARNEFALVKSGRSDFSSAAIL